MSFQSLCPSKRETIYLNLDLEYEYRPDHYEEVVCAGRTVIEEDPYHRPVSSKTYENYGKSRKNRKMIKICRKTGKMAKLMSFFLKIVIFCKMVKIGKWPQTAIIKKSIEIHEKNGEDTSLYFPENSLTISCVFLSFYWNHLPFTHVDISFNFLEFFFDLHQMLIFLDFPSDFRSI